MEATLPWRELFKLTLGSTFSLSSHKFTILCLHIFRHGNHQCFSCRGIQIAVQEFLKRGHTEITAFVPQWRTKFHQNDRMPIRDQHLLEELRKQGYLTYTPARTVPTVQGRYKHIASYDDRWDSLISFCVLSKYRRLLILSTSTFMSSCLIQVRSQPGHSH